jgi:hypothetical protein
MAGKTWERSFVKKNRTKSKLKIAAQFAIEALEERRLLSFQTQTIWVDDQLPAGATSIGEEWNWTSQSPAPTSGALAHQSDASPGIHQHGFQNANAEPLPVFRGDALVTDVYLNPTNTPQELMLQWQDTAGVQHRAYWGADLIPWGTRTSMGALPAAGTWAHLQVPADAVGLADHYVNGMTFTLYGGQATFDRSGAANLSGNTAVNDLQASQSGDEIDLSWGGKRDALNYDILRSTLSDFSWEENIGNTTATSFADTNYPGSNTYYYRIRAHNAAGDENDPGNIASVNVVEQGQGLTATSVGMYEVDLSWGSVSGAYEYALYRDDTYYGTVSGTYWNDSSVTPGSTYGYRIEPHGSSNPAGSSLTVTTPSLPPIAALRVSGVGSGSVDLTWGSRPDAYFYRVQRASDSSFYDSQDVADVYYNTAFTDYGVSSGNAYYYRIQTYDSSWNVLDTSSAVSATTMADGSPTAVSDLQAAVISSTEVDLTWAALEQGVPYYQVFRSTDPGFGWSDNLGTAYSNSWNDTTAAAGITYYYQVVPYDNNGQLSTATASVSAYTPPIPSPLAGVMDLWTTSNSANEVDVQWQTLSSAASYEIFRSTDQGFNNDLVDLGNTTAGSWADHTVPTGVFYYRVQAVGASGTTFLPGNLAGVVISDQPDVPAPGFDSYGTPRFATNRLDPTNVAPETLGLIDPIRSNTGYFGDLGYADFGYRFSAQAPVPISWTYVTNGTATPAVWMDSLGTHTRSITATALRTIHILLNSDGTWTDQETFRSDYTVNEIINAEGGAGSSLTQIGTLYDTMTINHYASSNHYSVDESGSDSYFYHTHAATDPLVTHTNDQTATQTFHYGSSGSRTDNLQAGTYTTSESFLYQAGGVDTNDDKQAHDAPLLAPNPSSDSSRNNVRTDWTYLAGGDRSQNTVGAESHAITSVYDRNTKRDFENHDKSSNDATVDTDGTSTHDTSHTQNDLIGTEKLKFHWDALDGVTPTSDTLSAHYTTSDTIIDDLTSPADSSHDLTDDSITGVSSSTHYASNSNTTRHRQLIQTNTAAETFNGNLSTFSGTTKGSNLVSSTWHIVEGTHSNGTDNSVEGVARTFHSDNDSTADGYGGSNFTSEGSLTIDAQGQSTRDGFGDTVANEAGTSTWNNADGSTINSDLTTGSQDNSTETKIVGSDSTTDIGDGSYTSSAHGHESYLPNGGTTRSGDSKHHAENNGKTTEDHDFTVDVDVSDNSTADVTRTTTSHAVHTTHSKSDYKTLSDGSGTYGDTSYSTTQTDSRHDDGTLVAHDDDKDESTIEDSRDDVAGSNANGTYIDSYASAINSEDRNGEFHADVSQTVIDNDGYTSTDDASSRTDSGDSKSSTTTYSDQTVLDKTVPNVSVSTTTTANYQADTTGKFNSSSADSDHLEGAVVTQSSSTDSDDDSGTMTESGDTKVSTTAHDTSFQQVVKHSQTDDYSDFDGNGTYETHSTDKTTFDQNGSYQKSTSSSKSHDTGNSSGENTATATSKGTYSPASGITDTVDTTLVTGDSRHGNYTSDVSDSDWSETNQNVSHSGSTSSNEWEDNGDDNWTVDSDDKTTEDDESQPNYDTSSTDDNHSKNKGDGTYETIRGLSVTTNDADTTTDAHSSDETSTDTEWHSTTTNSYWADDKRKAGIEKWADGTTTNHADGTGNDYSFISDKSHIDPDSALNTQTIESQNDSKTDGTTDTDSTNNSWDEYNTTETPSLKSVYTTAKNTAVTKLKSNGEYHDLNHDDSKNVDGEISGSESSTHTENGNITLDSETTDGTGHTDEQYYASDDPNDIEPTGTGEADWTSHSEQTSSGTYWNETHHDREDFTDGTFTLADSDDSGQDGTSDESDYSTTNSDQNDDNPLTNISSNSTSEIGSGGTDHDEYHVLNHSDSSANRDQSGEAHIANSKQDDDHYTYYSSNDTTSKTVTSTYTGGTASHIVTNQSSQDYTENGSGDASSGSMDSSDSTTTAPADEFEDPQTTTTTLDWTNHSDDGTYKWTANVWAMTKVEDPTLKYVTVSTTTATRNEKDGQGEYNNNDYWQNADGDTSSSNYSYRHGKASLDYSTLKVATAKGSGNVAGGGTHNVDISDTSTETLKNGTVEQTTESTHTDSDDGTHVYDDFDGKTEEGDSEFTQTHHSDTSDINTSDSHHNVGSKYTLDDSTNHLTGHSKQITNTTTTDEDGSVTVVGTDDHYESGSANWSSSTYKSTEAHHTNGDNHLLSASTWDNQTDIGSGGYETDHEWETTTINGWPSVEGYSEDKMYGSGNVTWNKGGLNSSTFPAYTASDGTDVTQMERGKQNACTGAG